MMIVILNKVKKVRLIGLLFLELYLDVKRLIIKNFYKIILDFSIIYDIINIENKTKKN